MYALLCNYASDNDHCWPSQTTLATRLSCSVSSVKKYLAELVGIKLVHVRREQYRSSVYYMLHPAPQNTPAPEPVAPVAQEAESDCQQPDSACPQPNSGYINTLNKQREIQNPPLPPAQPSSPRVKPDAAKVPVGVGDASLADFEKAWELYPKKEAKGLARSAWQKLSQQRQLPSLTRLTSCIRHFVATESWQRDQGRYVPQMANWLRGQRWLDDSVVAAAKEAEAAQHTATALQAMQQQDEARKAAQAEEREVLRPRFEAFAEKFHLHANPWLRPMAFGLWMHLHTTHRAPTSADVPNDNSLGIAEFLQAFKRRCEQALWHSSPQTLGNPPPRLHSVHAASRDNFQPHPVFSSPPARTAWAQAI